MAGIESFSVTWPPEPPDGTNAHGSLLLTDGDTARSNLSLAGLGQFATSLSKETSLRWLRGVQLRNTGDLGAPGSSMVGNRSLVECLCSQEWPRSSLQRSLRRGSR